ncbi:MAG: hypothetical protein JO026_03310 [Patescibacteria group bacterium]|nr:hypothetical protein [Patescibacteria group bacterium]
MHYDEDDLRNIADAYYARIRSETELNALVAASGELYQRGIREAEASKTRFSDSDLNSILERTRAYCRRLEKSCAHMIEGVSFGSEERLRAILAKRESSDPDTYAALSAPEASSFMTESVRFLSKIRESKMDDALVSEYIDTFGWAANSYMGASMLSAESVKARAAETSFARAASGFEQVWAEKERIMRDLSFTEEEKFVVRTIARLLSWQDIRKVRIFESIGALGQVMPELAEASDIGIELWGYALFEELTEERLSGGLEEELRERKKGVAFYATPERTLSFGGADFAQLEKTLHTAPEKHQMEFRGSVASKGIAVGKARICMNLSDISKTEEGEILVASMTRPEHLPAMQKAAAFVTDEGGITSHAAIVARELGKPCIIGTTVATKILKTGDLIEVDADRGVVRILKA